MHTLLKPPADDALLLLRGVAAGYAEAGEWPIWQWVMRWVRDQDEGLDPAEIFGDLPTWLHNYRPAWAVNVNGPTPYNVDDRIALSAVGMFHAGDGATNDLLRALVHSVSFASEVQAAARPPSPTQAVSVRLDAMELVNSVEKQWGIRVDPAILGDALRREPYVWGGLVINDPRTWSWDLNAGPLRAFRGLISAKDYLSRLEPLVVPITAPPVAHGLPASALPEALDHLNHVWRLATNDWLLRVRRCSSISTLAEPVVGAADFYAACTALADVLAGIDLPGEGPSLGRLQADLERRLPDATRALEGVTTLRHVVALRAGQQHSGSGTAERSDQARAALGLGRFASDWTRTWDHTRAATVGALRTIRDEIETLLPN